MKNYYTKTERFIAKLLEHCPIIKLLIKKLYQKINFIFYKKSYYYVVKLPINTLMDFNEKFFGYYDKSPLSPKEDFLIFHSVDYSTTYKPNPTRALNIICLEFKTRKIIKHFLTYAYNWQQGSRLQWVDDYKLIFNDYCYKTQKFIARLYDIKAETEIELIAPVYDVYRDFALTLNFDRLAILRPDYGYRNRILNMNSIQKHNLIKDIENDGIFKLFFSENKLKLLISLAQIINVLSENYIKPLVDINHKVNHIMISPNGENFIFLHRYFINNRKLDRLMLSNIEGTDLKVLIDHQMISHYFWKDCENIVCYMRVFGQGDNYYLINIRTGKISLINPILNQFGDGHPVIWKNYMFFDTYPNKARMQGLFVYNFYTQNLLQIGEFFLPFRFNDECRCDLHPKISFLGNYLFFESAHTSKRSLYWIKLEKEFK